MKSHLIFKLLIALSMLFSNLYINCQLLDDIKFTSDVFIHLIKTFGTVDNKVLARNPELYGIKGRNLRWSETDLLNGNQFITYGEKQTNMETVTCNVPQGPILKPLFIVFVYDRDKVAIYLELVIFTDDANFSYSHKNVKTLFQIVSSELKTCE